MKRLLSKVLFLSISATLLFTACEDDDEGVVNGDIVGSWELESLNLLYERVVSVPAGEDQNHNAIFARRFNQKNALTQKLTNMVL